MTFEKKLKMAMQELNINQMTVCRLTGKSKASISQYLSGKQTPSEKVRKDLAEALGLPADYFLDEPVIPKDAKVQKMLPEEAARILGISKDTVKKGLQQGVFPWGYAIRTTPNRWSYFINAKRFKEIEEVDT